ncbi:FkbM family methyltransferase [Aliisedimentitalea scapharcae]|uniref:FkbM family methyltransferase n=1 Tax=Aliisedimentitalea scapharcae TaxID=1524259 RepID=A0ABZ2XQ83_9RHOB
MNREAPQPRSQKMLARRVEFLQSVMSPQRRLRIADVGANPINTPDYDGLLKLGGCEVWGFEPEQSAFDALTQDPVPNTHYLQRAIGRTGQGTFYPHPQSGLGSLYPIRQESVSFLGKPGWHKGDVDGIEIALTALDDLSDEELPKPDVLKIDIQGGELDVFQSGRQKMSQAVSVIPEVRFYRMYEGEPLWGPVDVELHDQGYVLHKLVFAKSTVVQNSQRKRMKNAVFRNQLIDGDAVYIRNPETIDDWSDEQIKQLAMASACVFGSFDLTVFCLDALVDREVVDPQAPGQFLDKLPPWMFAEN